MKRPWMFVVVTILAVAACSSNHTDADVDAGEPDANADAPADAPAGLTVTSSGTLAITLELSMTTGGAGNVTVFVRTLAREEINDATVTFTKDGHDQGVPLLGLGAYVANFTGEGSTYGLAIVRGSDFVKVVGIDKLAIPVPSLAPDPPITNSAATVSWARPDDATGSVINVFKAGGGQVYPPEPQNDLDSGALIIPASVFSASGMYTFMLDRLRVATPDPNVKIKLSAMATFQRTVN